MAPCHSAGGSRRWLAASFFIVPWLLYLTGILFWTPHDGKAIAFLIGGAVFLFLGFIFLYRRARAKVESYLVAGFDRVSGKKFNWNNIGDPSRD
jgi:hypothetical protein